MSLPPPGIRWNSAMLVTPASQQHLAERTDALIQALPGRYQPFFWGVTGDVEYDIAALKDRILRIRSLDAVMRNGCHASADERARVQLPLSIDDGQSAVVRVALDDDAEHPRRFVPCHGDGAPVVVGEDGVEIPLSKPRFVLYDGRSSHARADTSFPLCEVRRQGGTYLLTGFQPPTLRVTPTSALGQRCRLIPPALRTEAGTVRDRGRLSAMIAALPAFEAMLAGSPHPFALYVELCRVAGAVAVLREDVLPAAFPEYDHDAAHVGFDSVFRYILKDGGEKASGAFRRFTFERDGGGFRLRRDPGWSDAISPGSGLDLVMMIESEDPQAQRWGENCLIATSSVAATLLGRRLLGCARRRITPGSALPSAPNLHHFRVTPNPGAAKPGEDLVVFGHFGGTEPSALYLYVNETPAGAP